MNSAEILKNLLARLPDMAGLVIALIMLFSIYTAQEARLAVLTEKYFLLTQCDTRGY